MTAELGQIALILALIFALVQAFVPLWGAWRGQENMMAIARPAAFGQFCFVAFAFALLTSAFVNQDFSVEYVARNSNSLLPLVYRISAVWGAHEGSLLLWALILSGWTLAVAAGSRHLPQTFAARVLAVMGIISIGFLLFSLLTSNPFSRLLPSPVDGNDLNPLLQDPGLIIHPPMLYMGYVGFSVAFAFSVAALLSGKIDRDWVRWCRPWTHLAWAFLTVGIALGSWWAYYELGWGGWWFWDPVENASFLPWLAGTALIHSQAVTDKRGTFQGWTLLLAICAFSLSLLGTFLVRSGVLTSVHAFASDPTRGLFILAFLGLVTGGALLLYALRAPKTVTGGQFAGWSRETLLLINNLFLTVAAAMVLIGTLYPLLIDALGRGKISVGAPYFGLMFIMLTAPLVLVMPFGPFTRWKQDGLRRVLTRLGLPLLAALSAGGITAIAAPESGLRGIAGVAGGVWLIAGSLVYAFGRIARQRGWQLPRGELAMSLAHIGVGVFVIGVSMTETISTEKHLAMNPGDQADIAGYAFEFRGTEVLRGPNWVADQGHFIVRSGERIVAQLYPQKRHYRAGGDIMTESAIDPGITRDLYISLGEPLDDQGRRWAVRIYHKPFVRWIWLGALLIAFGGLLAATDRRYRRYRRTGAVDAVSDDGTARSLA